ncbi:DUF2062 domain-containing protein [Candidatus Puniceispirillum sp.]|uniref:DUF2062 domain-containing protein n=1 Tax=Candidatus Puniceispirillum sp. TaxID=2026719 RepID=UPI001ED62EFA|nr:DUF2062 domain-containing protein [Candidatus Puniceispirillum sp.]MBT6566096.1 DUF2062 domain-containing protein [Candidatus Puniceispirillum sp.]
MTTLSKLRGIMWPERGFRRLFSYLMQRVLRTPGSTSSIAVSLSFGVAISFTPFIGFHLILAAVLTSLARGNVLVSAIGTFIGNPWTFPVIWYADYELGVVILRGLGFDISRQSLSLGQFSSHPTDLLLPLALGGFVLGAISWFTTFGLAYWTIDVWRQHRAKRLMEAKLRRSQSDTSDTTRDASSHADQKTDQDK